MQKRFYVWRGTPGSGKSELACLLCPRTNVAADDYPGLYNEDGSYNFHLQMKSHKWCFDTVEKWMQDGEEAIAVHNTFMQLKYLQNYIEVAKKYGYSTQIIHVEGVILPDGERTQSVHNVPREVMERMANSFEPLPTGYEEYVPEY